MRTSIRVAKPILVAACLLVIAGCAGGPGVGLETQSSLRGTDACARPATKPSHEIRASAASCKRHDGQTRNEFLLAAAAAAYRLRFAEPMGYVGLSASNDPAIYLFSIRGPPLS